MTTTYEQHDTLLHVQNLSVAYGDKLILSDVNFEEKNTIRQGMNQGQIIAFLGRSGRGKSTLFRALTGLEKPTTGAILIPDFEKQIIEGKQPAKKVAEGDVGFVDQKYTLFRHKTIYQTLQYALRKSDMSPTAKDEKIMSYLNDWGLAKNKDQYPNELSGGQRQRTAILEQLLSSGLYMVLDEPFSGLDVGNVESVKNAFKLIDQNNDLNTIIFSTHDIELAVELADSIYVVGYKDLNTPVGTILQNFDLKQMGLAWHDGLKPQHLDLVKQIKDLMLRS
jgi:ABC-type nitrate/sulfonate/bicarbonate transport system ATPase subunit